MHLRTIAIYAVAIALATPLAAQEKGVAEMITADSVLHHIGVIANDSMKGRAMPSAELDKTAQYIADRFQQLGLRPGGDSGWFQSYPISPRLDFARSRVIFAAGEKSIAIDFMKAARLGLTTMPEQPMRESVLLVAGPHTTTTIQKASNRGKIVLYVTPANGDAAHRMKVVEQLSTGNKGLIVLSDADTASFAERVKAAHAQPIIRVVPAPRPTTGDTAANRQPGARSNATWAAHVQPDMVKELSALLPAGGLNLDEARTDTALVIRELPGLEIGFAPAFDRTLGDSATGKNVVGILKGSDPELSKEYVIVSAHMDHVGVSSGKTDSINNGFDDNASGTAGILELAKAFSQPGARPRRSLVFLATSGGAHGYWGSRNFAIQGQNMSATFNSLKQIFGNTVPFPGLGGSPVYIPIVNLNLDRIGKNTGDSLMVNGLNELKLATPMPWIAAAHPELSLSLVDAGPVYDPESGHYAFARVGIPSLHLSTNTPDDTSQVGDSLSAINADQEVRILRYVYYLVQDIANAGLRPVLTPEGRRHFLYIRRE